MSKAWKEFEKETAEFFGGLRRIRVSYDESVGDVIHPTYSIECKYGKQIPKYLQVDEPTKFVVGREYFRIYRVCPSEILHVENGTLGFNYCPLKWKMKRKPTAQFLCDAMEQAKDYNPTLKPLVCVKPKHWRGFVVIWK